jgi:hypothetical protein
LRLAGLNSGPAGAYGLVSGGSLTRSSNVASVSNPRPGVFCIQLISGDPRQVGLVVTPDFARDTSSFQATGNHAIAEWRSDSNACGSDRLEVQTGRQRSDGTLERLNQGFSFSVPTAPAVFYDSRGGGTLTGQLEGDPNPLATLELRINAKASIGGGGSEQRRAVAWCRR